MKDRQERLFGCLDALSISYHRIDVHSEGVAFLEQNSPLGIQLPQLFDHSKFLGGFDDFEGAVGAGRLYEFFYSDIVMQKPNHE